MALSLEQLKAAFSKKSTSSEGNTGFWDKFYPFYKMDTDAIAEWRFFPDLNEDNPLGFMVENKYHELVINGQKKRIACLKMYGEACPCCELSQKHYNEGDTAMGKKYWRKIDYIGQGVVVSSPFEYPIKADENPVRLVSIGPKLYKKIEAGIVTGDLDAMPYDFQEGYNFRIIKSKQGEYASYDNSEFRRKATPVDAAILDRVELYDLSKFRYAKIEREAMEAMIEAEMTGRSYEDNKSGGSTTSTPAASTGSAALDEKVSAPKETVEAPATETPSAPAAPAGDGQKLSAQDILARLRNRTAS